MDVEWDERKRLYNIEKHALDFYDFGYVVDNPYIRVPARLTGGEVREMIIGMLDDICVTVVFTMRGSSYRLISMRMARRHERRAYSQAFGG